MIIDSWKFDLNKDGSVTNSLRKFLLRCDQTACRLGIKKVESLDRFADYGVEDMDWAEPAGLAKFVPGPQAESYELKFVGSLETKK